MLLPRLVDELSITLVCQGILVKTSYGNRQVWNANHDPCLG
jgi:hypothetical protein